MGDEKHVRQRKKAKQHSQNTPKTKSTRSEVKKKEEISWAMGIGSYINCVIGLVVMFYIAYKYAVYCNTLHENRLWFSNIKEIEREISFRTEAGLYYSYYKQLVNAPSLQQGLYDLTHDNITEHTVTMNVLERMNIYQEVILAVIYRNLAVVKSSFEPVFFYLYAIFALHGGLICCLYLTSWFLSGSWLAGVLTVAFYFVNKDDTTRVAYVVPLRESFSFPYLWGQLMCITLYFRKKSTKFQQKMCLLGIMKCTFLFSLFWQFNQFVLLLQAMALFGVQILNIVPHRKVRNVYIIQILSLLSVCALQYFNTMIIAGPVFSFIPAAILIMFIQGERPSSNGIILRIIKVIVYIALVFALMVSCLKVLKLVFPVDSDEHIYKFVLDKFGFAHYTDFDVNLYVCNGAFTFLSPDTFHRMTQKLVFPFYCIGHMMGLLCLGVGLLQKWRKESTMKKNDDSQIEKKELLLKSSPELCYHLIQAVFFGALGIMTLRMKYLWTPYICIIGTQALCHPGFYTWILSKCGISSKLMQEFVRNAILVVMIGLLVYLISPTVQKELDDLREFYDPDTVQLMEWINKNTDKTAAFTGSMQLLAGVKLCTGRPITNHPHYEDKHLRQRTKELYSMYSKVEPQNVHTIMLKYNASYAILEDSICLSKKDRCSLGTILDLDMGLVPDNPENGKHVPGLVKTTTPRFCDMVRHLEGEYKKYFKLVFHNKTFRVYQVLTGV